MNLLPSQQFLLDAASATCVSGTPSVPFMTNCSIGLVNSNSITLNGATPLNQLGPITGGYDGYGNESITWNLPSVNANGIVEVVGQTKTFRPSDATNPQTMYGVYLMDSGSVNLMAAAPFDGGIGIPMQSALNSLTILISYQPVTQSFIITYVA